MLVRCAALALVALLAGCAQAPPLEPSASSTATPPSQPHPDAPATLPNLLPGIHATRISAGAEPSILTDRNGRYVWIGDTTGVYYSVDNGTSWSPALTYAGNFEVAFGDGVGLAQNEAGTLYGAFLHDNRVDVARAPDGKSFGSPTYGAGVSGTADRPWLAAQGNNVVLFYFDAPAVAVGIFEHCAHSTDGGTTFTERNPVAGPPQGGKAFFDSKGRFYYSQDSGTVYRFDSCLGGATAITMIPNAGVNNMIQTDVEGTDLYMAAATSNSAEITLAGSHDGGPSKRIVVSPPTLKSNTYASVSVHDGQVAVAWYGSTTAGDPSSSSFSGDFDVYVSTVDGFWSDTPSITTVRVTDAPNHHGWICMGGIGCTGGRELLDYFMLDHDKWGGLHVAWVDDTSTAQVQYAHLPPATSGGGGGPGPHHLVADFSASVSGLHVEVDATASVGAATYSWDWGDGASGDGVTAGHEYASAATYTVTLTARASDGGAASHAVTLTVGQGDNEVPHAAFTFAPGNPKPGQAVTFTDTSTDDGDLTDLAWDFGDGATASGPSATHAFAKAGSFAVKLTATDDKGASASHTETVKVGSGGTTTTSTSSTSHSSTTSFKAPGPRAAMGLLGLLGLALLRRRLA